MVTIITISVMVLIFSGALYLGRLVWARLWWRSLRDVAAQSPEGMPLRPAMILSSIAAMIAVSSGFVFLYVLSSHAPLLRLNQRMAIKLHPIGVVPPITKSDLVSTSPRVKVLIDDSMDDVSLPLDVLKQCTDTEITYVGATGNVSCVAEGSKEAQRLLDRVKPPMESPLAPQLPPPGIKQQGFFPAISTTTTEAAKVVAERSGIHRYAEVIYFILTFIGVFLRICWDAIQTPHRGKKPPLLTLSSVITSLVLAITVYALIIQSGLAGSSDLLSFKTGIFATYNGLLAKSFLDLTTLKRPVAA